MMTQKRRRASSMATRSGISPMRWVGLFTCLVTVQAIVAAGPGIDEGGGTYRWHGELVSYDYATMTVKSRIVTQAGMSEVEGLEDGDPIVITWSGFGDRANGIRFVQPVRPMADRFRLPAEFAGFDPGSQYVTFQIGIPAGSVATARVFRPGMWMTVTSSHGAGDDAGAVKALDRFAATDSGQGAADPSLYRWHAEFVSLDDAARTVTLRSRIVSRERLAALGGLTRGEPIAITWSGFGNSANGIRFVERDHQRLDDHLRLPAEFVAVDRETRYLTFRVAKPMNSVGASYALTPGDWATVTSSLGATDMADAVVTVQAFDSTRRMQPASLVASTKVKEPKTGTYRWHGELVSLDRSTQTITVRSRIVSQEGLVGLGDLDPGDAIVITWSGFDDRANGIRLVAPAGRASASADGFQLPAEFVAVDLDTRYLTFAVKTSAGSLVAADTLVPGDWTTVTSPHRLSEDAVVLVDAYDTSRQARRYTWHGELVALDRDDAAVAFAAPVEEHVLRYVERFHEGDEVVLVWTPEADDVVNAVRYIEHRAHSVLDHGYVLPVEFSTADANAQRIIFKTKVPPSTLSTWASIQPGSAVAVTSLFEQSGETAAILIQ